MIDDLKNSPIPSLFFLGYRIASAHRNKKDEVILHFAKPENAVLYEENRTAYEVCTQKLNECIQPYHKPHEVTTIDQCAHKPSKSFMTRLWDILCKIFACFKCRK